jgi:C4-dicarboxylate-specific signal transduction histidine kinase
VCDDEVGVLTDAFNQMLAQIQSQDSALQRAQRELQQQVNALQREINEREQAEEALRISQQKLLESSRLAGMAEVATGVLHNVGNVLNSVNVSAGIVMEKLRRSKAPKLAKAAALLTSQNGSLAEYLTKDPNGQKLPGYLSKLGEFFVSENAELLAEVDQLGRNIEHIKEVVAMQQSYAKVSGVFENLPAHRLVEDAIAMNIGAFERHGVVVDRQFSNVPLVRVDRHKVLQILINLLRNAKYALDESGRTDKRITISVFAANDRSVHIVVVDNGIGISAENLTRIFAHGFTTREEGHGFGLHSGALAAHAMGGSLSVTSAGTGHGAAFTLELPIAPPFPKT